MIISISGKMGSGKDTVGEIIQLLDDGSFTDEGIEKYLINKIGPSWTNSKFINKKWAFKVKEVATLLTGIPVEKFENQEFKEIYLDDFDMTVRTLLQKIGTDAIRDGLHIDAWVISMMREYDDENSDWIITDTRFPNEVKAVKAMEGITIRVKRAHGYTNPHTGEYKEIPLNFHESETALDDATFDYEIDNDGDIRDLIKKVKLILRVAKVI